MTRIPVHSVDSAPEGSRDALEALEAKFGKVLNIHGAMAHAPAVLNTYAAVQGSLQDTGTLAGWTDAELTETSAHVALNLFTNYFNHLVQTDQDLPAAPSL